MIYQSAIAAINKLCHFSKGSVSRAKINKPKINPETKPTNMLIFRSMVYFDQPGFQKQTAGFRYNGRATNALLQVKGVGHE